MKIRHDTKHVVIRSATVSLALWIMEDGEKNGEEVEGSRSRGPTEQRPYAQVSVVATKGLRQFPCG